jgi:hypothetical protein
MVKKTSGSAINRNRIDRKFIAKTESEIANPMPLPKNELPAPSNKKGAFKLGVIKTRH